MRYGQRRGLSILMLHANYTSWRFENSQKSTALIQVSSKVLDDLTVHQPPKGIRTLIHTNLSANRIQAALTTIVSAIMNIMRS